MRNTAAKPRPTLQTRACETRVSGLYPDLGTGELRNLAVLLRAVLPGAGGVHVLTEAILAVQAVYVSVSCVDGYSPYFYSPDLDYPQARDARLYDV